MIYTTLLIWPKAFLLLWDPVIYTIQLCEIKAFLFPQDPVTCTILLYQTKLFFHGRFHLCIAFFFPFCMLFFLTMRLMFCHYLLSSSIWQISWTTYKFNTIFYIFTLELFFCNIHRWLNKKIYIIHFFKYIKCATRTESYDKVLNTFCFCFHIIGLKNTAEAVIWNPH